MKITSLAKLKNLISTGNCPTGLTLNLHHDLIGLGRAKWLANTIGSGNCPAGLTLDLKYNDISDAGAEAFATAVASGDCPAELTLDLWNKNLTDAGAQAFASAIAHPKVPDDLKIKIDDTLMNKAYWQSALKEYRFNRYGKKLLVLACGIAGSNQACILPRLTDNTAILTPIIRYLYPTRNIGNLTQHTQMLISFIHHRHDKAIAGTRIQRLMRGIACATKPLLIIPMTLALITVRLSRCLTRAPINHSHISPISSIHHDPNYYSENSLTTTNTKKTKYNKNAI